MRQIKNYADIKFRTSNAQTFKLIVLSRIVNVMSPISSCQSQNL